AIKEVCKFKTATYHVITIINQDVRRKLMSNSPGNEALYDIFFEAAREQKMEKDSLAEELILICIIVLTKVPLGKYIIISDDLEIRNVVISIADYIKKHHDIKAPMQLTTSRLIYELYKKQIVKEKNDLFDILSASFHGNVKVFYIGKDDIKLNYDAFTKENLIDEMMKDSDFRIVY
ncbi:MAG: transposase, partial [Clostridia bacterium]|nr:transposase [Clostridia bacterium]